MPVELCCVQLIIIADGIVLCAVDNHSCSTDGIVLCAIDKRRCSIGGIVLCAGTV